MAITREQLKWLFSAEFADGSFIDQDQDDRCLTRTDGTGSRFTDVLSRPDKPVAFHLINFESHETVTVDLITGAFVVNGTPIHIHEQNFDPMNHELSLLYFRETRVERDLDSKGTVLEDRHFVNRYFIGWETFSPSDKRTHALLAVG